MSSPIIVGLALRADDAAPLALARRLARITEAPLALCTTLPSEVPTPMPTPQYTLALRDDAKTRLAEVAETLAGELEVTTHVHLGSRAGVLHDLAEQLGAAAIVVGSSHRGRVGRLLIGDVAVGLLHGSPCPVAVAPRDYDAMPGSDLTRIGVAFDGTPESGEALTAALALAGRTGGAVSSFTVLEPTDWNGTSTVPGWVPSPAAEESRSEHAQAIAQQALDALDAAPAGALASSEVLHGRVVDVLAGVSHELDLLVCGSRGYGPMRAVLLGGVSRRLAAEAHCPVIVLPRGVESSLEALIAEAPGAAAA
jgi:nucleotide-binding universal stress UspA family protein